MSSPCLLCSWKRASTFTCTLVLPLKYLKILYVFYENNSTVQSTQGGPVDGTPKKGSEAERAQLLPLRERGPCAEKQNCQVCSRTTEHHVRPVHGALNFSSEEVVQELDQSRFHDIWKG